MTFVSHPHPLDPMASSLFFFMPVAQGIGRYTSPNLFYPWISSPPDRVCLPFLGTLGLVTQFASFFLVLRFLVTHVTFPFLLGFGTLFWFFCFPFPGFLITQYIGYRSQSNSLQGPLSQDNALYIIPLCGDVFLFFPWSTLSLAFRVGLLGPLWATSPISPPFSILISAFHFPALE